MVQSLELEDGALRGYANDGLTSNHQPFRRESDANPAVNLSDITISQKLEGGERSGSGRRETSAVDFKRGDLVWEIVFRVKSSNKETTHNY